MTTKLGKLLLLLFIPTLGYAIGNTDAQSLYGSNKNGSGLFNFNSSGTVTIPNVTGTVLVTGGAIGGFGTSIAIVTDGSGNLASSSTTAAEIVFVHTVTSQLCGINQSCTETNKTFTLPVIASISNGGTVTIPSGTDTLVARTSTDTLTNKKLSDSTTTVVGSADPTKILKFDVSASTTTGTTLTFRGNQSTTQTVDFPNVGASTTVVTDKNTQTLTNKTMDTATNTLTGLANANLSGSAGITDANLATMGANTVKANVTGSGATPTAVAETSAATASTFPFRDANGNVGFNRVGQHYTTTATAAGTTTFTAASARIEYFTGVTTQTVKMPVGNAAGMFGAGDQFEIHNLSTGALTLQDSGAGAITTQSAGSICFITMLTSANPGTWDFYCGVNGAGGGTVTTAGAFNNTSTANGLDVSGANVALHAADGTNPGAVTTGTQTIAGAKTLTGALTLQAAETNSTNGASATPALKLSGTPDSADGGTNNKALLLLEDASTSNTWNTAGTYLGINAKTGFTGYLLQAGLNAANRFSVDSAGKVIAGGEIDTGNSAGFKAGSTGLFYQTGSTLIIGNTGSANPAGVPQIQMANLTDTNTSGTDTAVEITPTYNQASATTANTDLLINRTETSVGSGTQKLIDAQVASTSKFSVGDTGVQISGVFSSDYANNIGISASGSTTLTLALKQADASTDCSASAPCNLSFFAGAGSYTNLSITAAMSITLAAADSIGFASGVRAPMYLYVIKDTTSELCASSRLFNTDEGGVSATALTGGADTTFNVLWCPSVHTAKAIRLVGQISAVWSNPNWGSISDQVFIFPTRTMGSLTNDALAPWRHESAKVGSSTTTACSSTPCGSVVASSPWISSVTWNSTGNYVVNIRTGYFSAAPTCQITPGRPGGPAVTATLNDFETTTTVPLTCNDLATPTVRDCIFSIACDGPR